MRPPWLGLSLLLLGKQPGTTTALPLQLALISLTMREEVKEEVKEVVKNHCSEDIQNSLNRLGFLKGH